MVDPRDPGTIAMLFKRRRGRPSTGKAKTAAERMRAYRARHVTVRSDVLRSVIAQCQEIQQLLESNQALRDELDAAYAEITRLRSGQ
ncbi:hypothetical protein [Dyella acidisoli]|uniref:BZIP domain-containing protein n=1 Tax=Dyella acidisoli TaxID=1867834 RepID=A0ABQ5XW05_9GAMM|nr:hypothetical protein [Dyella acidisoli]GLQ94952.1 hypothetical protein GCM10007901_39050 [Dyella acidisoli]